MTPRFFLEFPPLFFQIRKSADQKSSRADCDRWGHLFLQLGSSIWWDGWNSRSPDPIDRWGFPWNSPLEISGCCNENECYFEILFVEPWLTFSVVLVEVECSNLPRGNHEIAQWEQNSSSLYPGLLQVSKKMQLVFFFQRVPFQIPCVAFECWIYKMLPTLFGWMLWSTILALPCVATVSKRKQQTKKGPWTTAKWNHQR